MYERIMVPLDGSTFAEAALPLALTLSRHTGAALHVVTVLEPTTSFAYDGWESAALEWSKEYLAGLEERIGGSAGGPVITTVLSGHTLEQLLQVATEREIDVVVMATHGRGALSRLWLGSVADAFARHAERPVILIRPDEDGSAPEAFTEEFRTLLVPLDGSELSESALGHAVEFGELFDAAYHLTRAVVQPFDVASPYLPHTVQMNQEIVEDAKKHAAAYLEGHAERLRRRGLSVTTSVVVDGQPGGVVLREAEEVGAEAIAMATHGRSGIDRALLGSTADKVLRGTHLPVLLYRPAVLPG
jgi:nucleotide-binding universal stress UspA family protein